VTSFLSLGFASFEMFFTERVFEEKDDPDYKFLWNIGFLSYLDAFASVIIITLGFALGREFGWIGIAGVILSIFEKLAKTSLFKKHIYYIDAIKDPLKYKNDPIR